MRSIAEIRRSAEKSMKSNKMNHAQKDQIYFAHPVTHYNEPEENTCFFVIKEYFSMVYKQMNFAHGETKEQDGRWFQIVNPNQHWIQRRYNDLKEQQANDEILDDGYADPFDFFNDLVKACQITVGVPILSTGLFGAGVANEMRTSLKNGALVFELVPAFGGKDFQSQPYTLRHVNSYRMDKIMMSSYTIEDTRKLINAGAK